MTSARLEGQELADFLAGLCRVSRPIISKWFRATGTVEWKSDASPVTMADRQVERALREAIAARFPQDDILGEEHETQRGCGDSGYSWVIDPIDGTRGFVCGRPVFGTLVGLVREGVPVAGLIDVPMIDECYVAAGGRAALNGAPIKTSQAKRVADARIATTAPEAFTQESLARFNRLASACAITCYGGDCHNYGLLAAGHLDIVMEDGLASHDIMGVVEVVRAAGGVITDMRGDAVNMDDTGSLLAAATPALHAEALAIVGAAGR